MFNKLIRFLKSNLVIILLSMTAVISILPLLKYGMLSVFYNVDPDVVYVGNAIAYVKSHVMYYRDHPGTPVMIYLAWSYWPLRIYAKLIAHQPFVTWSFDNLRFLFIYSRMAIFSVFYLSIFIYLKSLKNIINSLTTSIFAWAGLFSFMPLFTLGPKISAENGTFFVISVWLFIFSLYLKNRDVFYLFLLAIVTGIGEAVKINNFALIFTTFLLVLFSQREKFDQKVKYIFIMSVLVAVAFFVSTWPIKEMYQPMFSRFTRVVEGSGIEGAHGEGNTPFVDLSGYVINLKNIYGSNKLPSYFVLAAIGIIVYEFVKKKIKFKDPLFLLFIGTFISFLILLKYPHAYYQLSNYLLFVFLISCCFGRLRLSIRILLVCLLAIPFIRVVVNGVFNESQNANSAVVLENYISEHPAKIATLWDYGPTQDFAYIWIRAWARGLFLDELAAKRPDLLELDVDYEKVYRRYYNDVHNVWGICWDKLYIRQDRAKQFLNRYPDKTLSVTSIADGFIWVIDSNRCLPKK